MIILFFMVCSIKWEIKQSASSIGRGGGVCQIQNVSNKYRIVSSNTRSIEKLHLFIQNIYR